jgi:hypothetical protein
VNNEQLAKIRERRLTVDESVPVKVILQSPNGQHRYIIHVTDEGRLAVSKLRNEKGKWVLAANDQGRKILANPVSGETLA